MIVFERIVGFAVIGFMIWQFAIPVFFGLPPFPLFRRRVPEKDLLAEISEAKRTLMIDDLRSELHWLRSQHEKTDGKEEKSEQ